jgi:hypothetical protein
MPRKSLSKPDKRPSAKLSDKEQSERFIEAARKLGIEDTTEVFNEAIRKIIKKEKSNTP